MPGKLSTEQVAELTALIRDYKRQTSIEIAVVVVDSLQGQSAKEYAIGIGNSWGVGKADRNNGIVLLWAPHERVYSLRIADGLSQDLSGADATDITHNNLVPNFKRENYYEGLKDTVTAVIRHLGNEAWEERLKLRQEKNSIPKWLISPFAAVGTFTAVIIILRRRKRNLKLQEMAAVPGSIVQNLDLAQQNVLRIQQFLDDFKQKMPEQDLTRFTSDLAGQPKRIAMIKEDIARVNVSDITAYAEVLQIKERAEAEAGLLGNIHWKLDEIFQAKTQSQRLIQELSKESFQIGNLRDGSRRSEVDNLLFNSRTLYDQASQNSSMSILDWILINNLLNNSQSQVQQAVQVSQAEPYVAPSLFDSSSSTFDSGGSSGSGGDFGGGGGFSDGSGSDGSY
jgi:uncharacterized membrane protein YgcG